MFDQEEAVKALISDAIAISEKARYDHDIEAWLAEMPSEEVTNVKILDYLTDSILRELAGLGIEVTASFREAFPTYEGVKQFFALAKILLPIGMERHLSNHPEIVSWLAEHTENDGDLLQNYLYYHGTGNSGFMLAYKPAIDALSGGIVQGADFVRHYNSILGMMTGNNTQMPDLQQLTAMNKDLGDHVIRFWGLFSKYSNSVRDFGRQRIERRVNTHVSEQLRIGVMKTNCWINYGLLHEYGALSDMERNLLHTKFFEHKASSRMYPEHFAWANADIVDAADLIAMFCWHQTHGFYMDDDPEDSWKHIVSTLAPLKLEESLLNMVHAELAEHFDHIRIK